MRICRLWKITALCMAALLALCVPVSDGMRVSARALDEALVADALSEECPEEEELPEEETVPEEELGPEEESPTEEPDGGGVPAEDPAGELPEEDPALPDAEDPDSAVNADANTVWQYDFVYTLNSIDNSITITKYTGQSLDVTVPAIARVNDIIYHTQIKNNSNSASMWGNRVSKISFESGVKAISCAHLFHGCTGLTSVDLSGLNTSGVQNFSDMFTNCIHLGYVDFTGLDTSSAQDFHSMFKGCAALQDVIWGGIDTSRVASTVDMFNGCGALTNMDLSGLNLNNVTKSSAMFYNCSQIKRFNLQNWDMSGNFNGANMFTNCLGMVSVDTPLNLTVEIDLPVTLVDAQKKKYTQLPMNLTTTKHLVIPGDESAKEAWIRAFIARMYNVALGRDYDAEGYENWVQLLMNDSIDGAGVGAGFILSQEFKNRNLSNPDFVALLYRVFFAREPDQAGYEHWLNMLNRGSKRKVVLAGFINSPEFANTCADYGIRQGHMDLTPEDLETDDSVYRDKVLDFIRRMYLVALNREGEEWGVYMWTEKIMIGEVSVQDVASYGFYMSPEYQNRNRADTEFITDLYEGLFDRTPDLSEIYHWLYRLEQGESRESVIYGFTRSEEFSNMLASFGL
ncbi:MAG: DUF4214 domain-containing protein [Lachnospiraceae bacterium]|nr:DUF4214 domain-containing protein [Lachnospiraceae bacterium]